jgi:hypothetical protein
MCLRVGVPAAGKEVSEVFLGVWQGCRGWGIGIFIARSQLWVHELLNGSNLSQVVRLLAA